MEEPEALLAVAADAAQALDEGTLGVEGVQDEQRDAFRLATSILSDSVVYAAHEFLLRDDDHGVLGELLERGEVLAVDSDGRVKL